MMVCGVLLNFFEGAGAGIIIWGVTSLYVEARRYRLNR